MGVFHTFKRYSPTKLAFPFLKTKNQKHILSLLPFPKEGIGLNSEFGIRNWSDLGVVSMNWRFSTSSNNTAPQSWHSLFLKTKKFILSLFALSEGGHYFSARRGGFYFIIRGSAMYNIPHFLRAHAHVLSKRDYISLFL